MRASSGTRVVLKPADSWSALNLREVWQFRELFVFLAWRDIKVRYAQAVLGVAWAVIQPLLMMVVFTFVFGKLAQVPSDGVPYPVFSFAGLVPWIFFSSSMSGAANSLVGSAALVSRVWFPRLVLPGAALLSYLPDVAISTVILIGIAVAFGVAITPTILLLPVFVVFALLAAASVGIWLGALNVEYRDIRYVFPFLTQLWLFATPVAYPASSVPEQYQWLLGLNPMAGVVEGFRWAIIGQDEPPWTVIATSSVIVAVLLVSGLYYFRRVEHRFADVI